MVSVLGMEDGHEHREIQPRELHVCDEVGARNAPLEEEGLGGKRKGEGSMLYSHVRMEGSGGGGAGWHKIMRIKCSVFIMEIK